MCQALDGATQKRTPFAFAKRKHWLSNALSLALPLALVAHFYFLLVLLLDQHGLLERTSLLGGGNLAVPRHIEVEMHLTLRVTKAPGANAYKISRLSYIVRVFVCKCFCFAFRICIFFLFCFVMSCSYCFVFCSIAWCTLRCAFLPRKPWHLLLHLYRLWSKSTPLTNL